MEALHLWTQIVGKVRLELEPMVNHWWQVPLYVSARGLTTSLMHAGGLGLEMEFDFIDHRLEIRTARGATRERAARTRVGRRLLRRDRWRVSQTLAPRSAIRPYPNELPSTVAFPEDTASRPYDADAVHRFWLALVQIARVMYVFRARFQGKVSPVHFFWGADDLAVTRFSGRTAPQHAGGVPNCPDWVQQMAYSHEVSSCGYWPGGSDEGTFYSYAYPEPPGFAGHTVEPAAAAYDKNLGEFVLPYTAVREAEDPDATLLAFFQSTYEAAADSGKWDRAALEVGRHPVTGRPHQLNRLLGRRGLRRFRRFRRRSGLNLDRRRSLTLGGRRCSRSALGTFSALAVLGRVHLGPDLLREVGPRRLRLGLGGELALGVVEADVVALFVVGVLAEGLAVLLGDLAALGRLLDRQGDTAALQVDVDDLDPELLAGRDDLLGQVDVVHRHLADVHETLDAVAHLHEGAERHQLGDAAVDELAHGVRIGELLPRVGLRRLQRQA